MQRVAFHQKTLNVSILSSWLCRRLVAKGACFYAKSKIAEILQSSPSGVGVPGGCEAAVHAAQRFISNMEAVDVLVNPLDAKRPFIGAMQIS